MVNNIVITLHKDMMVARFITVIILQCMKMSDHYVVYLLLT